MLTDADHKSGFKLQSALLARLFQLVDVNIIVQPLYDQAAYPDTTTNAQFLRNYTANLLKNAFPHVSRSVDILLSFGRALIDYFSSQVTVFVTALFDQIGRAHV